MKTMSCNQLGGACDKTFSAETFEEMVELSKAHGMEMFQTQDAAHMAVMAKMAEMMQSPEDMQKYFDQKRAEFDAQPED